MAEGRTGGAKRWPWNAASQSQMGQWSASLDDVQPDLVDAAEGALGQEWLQALRAE